VTKVRIKRVVNMLDFLGSCSIHVDTVNKWDPASVWEG
jgi:hypothetical protein